MADDKFTDDMLPWPYIVPTDPTFGAYQDQSPPTEMEFKLGEHLMRVTPGVGSGIHSGRGRTRIECISCGKTIHRGTTGPRVMVLAHLNGQL